MPDGYVTIPFDKLGAAKTGCDLKHWPFLVAFKKDGSAVAPRSDGKNHFYTMYE